MKKIGIVGGIGWPSTVQYYAGICRMIEDRFDRAASEGAAPLPEMSIESLDLARAVAAIGRDGDEESWSRFEEYHRAALSRLEASGADFALIASNTAHHRFDGIVRGIGIPVLNIFDASAEECARLSASQVLILGTRVTMASSELRRRFAAQGVDAAEPAEEKARRAVEELIGALQRGDAEKAAPRLQRIARGAYARLFAGPPVVCLACTELPLAFPGWNELPSFALEGVTYVNSSAVHVAAAVARALAQ